MRSNPVLFRRLSIFFAAFIFLALITTVFLKIPHAQAQLIGCSGWIQTGTATDACSLVGNQYCQSNYGSNAFCEERVRPPSGGGPAQTYFKDFRCCIAAPTPTPTRPPTPTPTRTPTPRPPTPTPNCGGIGEICCSWSFPECTSPGSFCSGNRCVRISFPTSTPTPTPTNPPGCSCPPGNRCVPVNEGGSISYICIAPTSIPTPTSAPIPTATPVPINCSSIVVNGVGSQCSGISGACPANYSPYGASNQVRYGTNCTTPATPNRLCCFYSPVGNPTPSNTCSRVDVDGNGYAETCRDQTGEYKETCTADFSGRISYDCQSDNRCHQTVISCSASNFCVQNSNGQAICTGGPTSIPTRTPTPTVFGTPTPTPPSGPGNWFQSVGSDIRWDSGFFSQQIPSGQYASINGSGGMPGIIFSGVNSPGPVYGGGSSSTNNWEVRGDTYTSTHSIIPTSYTFLNETSTAQGQSPSNISSAVLNDSLVSGVYKKNGDLRVVGNYSFAPNTSVIILVNGNLEIANNASITVPQGSTAIFAVSGNIVVQGNVTNIQGVYSAGGNFTVDDGSSPLTIEGSLIVNAELNGGSFVNNRDLGAANSTTPSVQFVERPDFFLNYPTVVQQTSRSWQEVAP